MVILDKIKKIILKEDMSDMLSWYIIFFMFGLPSFYFLGRCIGINFFMQEELLEITNYLLITVLGYRVLRNKKIELKRIDFFLIILAIFAILATVFSKNINNSIFGACLNYSENILHILGYYSLLYICSHIIELRYRIRIIKAFFILAVLEGMVGILQRNHIWPYLCEHGSEGHYYSRAAFGFTQNCNFFAGLLTILLSIIVTIFIRKRTSLKVSMAIYASMIICYISALYTNARIAWLGVIGLIFSVITFEIVYFIINKKMIWKRISRIVIVICTFCAIFLALMYIGDNSVNSQIAEFKSDKHSISEKGDFDKYGSSRGYIWRMGIEAIKDNWIIGVGIDNYEYVFFSNPLYKEGGYYQAKAHCEYLQVLVDEGIFAFLIYISMLLYTFYINVKYVCTNKYEKEANIRYIMLISFCAYSVQALVNSSLVNVAPYYWISMGVLNNRKSEKTIYKVDFKA